MLLKNGSPAHQRIKAVLIDGEKLKDFLWADSEDNHACVYARDKKGKLIKKPDGTFRTMMRAGDITFVRK